MLTRNGENGPEDYDVDGIGIKYDVKGRKEIRHDKATKKEYKGLNFNGLLTLVIR
jgi:hypothetical protein